MRYSLVGLLRVVIGALQNYRRTRRSTDWIHGNTHYPVSSKSAWNGSIAILKESNLKQLVLQSKQHSSACLDDLYILSFREFISRSKTSAVSLTRQNQRHQGPTLARTFINIVAAPSVSLLCRCENITLVWFLFLLLLFRHLWCHYFLHVVSHVFVVVVAWFFLLLHNSYVILWTTTQSCLSIIYMYMCVCVCVLHTYIYIYIYIYVYVCVCVCVLYIYIYVYVCVCVCVLYIYIVCVYIYIYIYIAMIF